MSNIIWNEEVLNELLTTPSQALIADVAKIQGESGLNKDFMAAPCGK